MRVKLFALLIWFLSFSEMVKASELIPVESSAKRSERSQTTCEKMMRILAQKQTLEIRIVFGYKDARPARFVGDRHERLVFVQRILKSCSDSEVLCGFKRDSEDSDLFVRSVKRPDGTSMEARLRVAHSAVDSDDEANRKNLFQAWQSSYAEKVFLEGLGNADVVFYNGHSRYGGGPDFHVPRLLDSNHIHISHYQSQKKGLVRIKKKLKALGQAPSANLTPILGLFSCSSSQHFLGEMKSSLSPGSSMAFISSDETIHYSQALQESLEALRAILKFQCPQQTQVIAVSRK